MAQEDKYTPQLHWVPPLPQNMPPLVINPNLQYAARYAEVIPQTPRDTNVNNRQAMPPLVINQNLEYPARWAQLVVKNRE